MFNTVLKKKLAHFKIDTKPKHCSISLTTLILQYLHNLESEKIKQSQINVLKDILHWQTSLAATYVRVYLSFHAYNCAHTHTYSTPGEIYKNNFHLVAIHCQTIYLTRHNELAL